MKISVTEIALVGVFSALAVAGAFLFISIHNIEIFSATIFLSGLLLGQRNGMLVGVIASSIFSTFNPYGISPLPLFIAQALSRALVGYLGGRYAKLGLGKRRFWIRAIAFGVAGLLLTWVYILLTFSSSVFSMGFSLEQLKIWFVGGIVSYLILTVNNVLIFALVIPFVSRELSRMGLLKQVNIS
ncbi:ECF transporter S component [candidate division KSB1 bacterium]|nr:ECF transporter S component [candidate division KSB1 bacterium]